MNKVFQYIKITSIQVNDSYFTTQQITSTFVSTTGMWKFSESSYIITCNYILDSTTLRKSLSSPSSNQT